MPSEASAGTSSSANVWACSTMRAWLAMRLRASTSRGLSPLEDGTATPAAMRRFSPAMRTMKNSSRLLAKMPMKRTRSSNGTAGSCASSCTRALNAIHDSSRSRKRSSGSDPSAGSKGGSTSNSSGESGASRSATAMSGVSTARGWQVKVNAD